MIEILQKKTLQTAISSLKRSQVNTSLFKLGYVFRGLRGKTKV